jgi:ferredoxin
MRLTADTGVCVGAGMCALTDPDLFDQSDDDGTVVLLTAEVPAGREGTVGEAVRRCPSGALALAD